MSILAVTSHKMFKIHALVVPNGSPIKWSMPLPLMATVKTKMVREERWRETTRMVVLKQQDSLETTDVDHMRFKDKLKHKYKHEENPQVRKTGVDAVHGSCPQRSNM